MTSKLAIARLSKSFGDLEALRGISLAVERGEFISVVGPSGCGKTTFLRIVAGLEHASAGEVLLDGRAVREPGTDRGFVFQNDSLLPWRTAFANAIIGREVAGKIGPADRKRTMELLKLVGLEGFENYHPRQLSGGMRQRVNLARALAIDPDILLMDEPFAALDAQTRELVFALRPGRLQEEIKIALPRPRNLAIKRTPEFVALVDHIWRLIEDDVRAAALYENA